MAKPRTIDKGITHRIRGHGREWIFSASDFADLGARPAIDSTLRRLLEAGMIRRVVRGLYLYPLFSEFLGQELSPGIDEAARALARKFGWRIQPSGVLAENLLGLSTQVPAHTVYLSNGPSKRYKIGNRTITFKHTALKETGFKLRESELIVQALKSIGSEHVTLEVIDKIRRGLPKPMHEKVLRDTRTATGWVRAAIQQVVREV